MTSEIGKKKRDRVRNRNITPLLSLKSPRLQLSLNPNSRKCLLLGHCLLPPLLLHTCDASRTHADHVPSTSRMTHKMDSQSPHVPAYRGGTCRTNLGCVRLVGCGCRSPPLYLP